jgi:hypothetical protein
MSGLCPGTLQNAVKLHQPTCLCMVTLCIEMEWRPLYYSSIMQGLDLN